MESELDQADWIDGWDERGDLLDRVFPNLIQVVSRADRKEQGPVLLWRPSFASTATRVRVG